MDRAFRGKWGVAPGVALILDTWEMVVEADPKRICFNRPRAKLTRMLAASPILIPQIQAEIALRMA